MNVNNFQSKGWCKHLKFVRFKNGISERFGILREDCVYPIKGDIFKEYIIEDNYLKLEDVQLLSPLKPGKVIAIGLNYNDHVGELDFAANIPEEPISFLVSNTAIIGPEDTIYLNSYDHRVDFEAELVAVIGAKAENVKEEDALEYVLGYTCGNDVSDRNIQKQDTQWTRAKSFPTYKPIGPWIETELHPDNLDIQTIVNGEIKQNSNTKNLIFSTAKLIAFLSSYMTLYPGDIIMTGTPQGVGPLQKGDIVEINIPKIGILRNYVK